MTDPLQFYVNRVSCIEPGDVISFSLEYVFRDLGKLVPHGRVSCFEAALDLIMKELDGADYQFIGFVDMRNHSLRFRRLTIPIPEEERDKIKTWLPPEMPRPERRLWREYSTMQGTLYERLIENKIPLDLPVFETRGSFLQWATQFDPTPRHG